MFLQGVGKDPRPLSNADTHDREGSPKHRSQNVDYIKQYTIAIVKPGWLLKPMIDIVLFQSAWENLLSFIINKIKLINLNRLFLFFFVFFSRHLNVVCFQTWTTISHMMWVSSFLSSTLNKIFLHFKKDSSKIAHSIICFMV